MKRFANNLVLILAAFLGVSLIAFGAAKLASVGNLLKRSDWFLFLGAAVVELCAGSYLLWRPMRLLGWLGALALGVAFSIYSWLDSEPICNCLGVFRSLNKVERYYLSLLFAGVSITGLWLLQHPSSSIQSFQSEEKKP